MNTPPIDRLSDVTLADVIEATVAARGQSRDRMQISFTIRVAAEMIGVHQQTLRHYERLGLIQPRRGAGKVGIRYYTPEDMDRLAQIKRLLDDLHVNLAGVEVILNMTERMEQMQADMQRDMSEMRAAYEREIAHLKDIIRRSVLS